MSFFLTSNSFWINGEDNYKINNTPMSLTKIKLNKTINVLLKITKQHSRFPLATNFLNWHDKQVFVLFTENVLKLYTIFSIKYLNVYRKWISLYRIIPYINFRIKLKLNVFIWCAILFSSIKSSICQYALLILLYF